MQATLSVCVLVKSNQPESRLKLSSNLLFQRMGKLHAGIFLFKLPSLIRIAQRVERESVDNHFFFAIHNVVDIVVGTGQQPAPRLQKPDEK